MTRVQLPAILTVLLASAGPAGAGDGLTVSLGPGVKYGPVYFGASERGFRPTGKISFGDGTPKPGLSVHGAARYIGARRTAEHAELSGLEDVPMAFELGGGLVWGGENYRLFADVRQGFGGHSGQVLELGGDYAVPLGERLTLSFGPRATFATRPFFDAYFNVTPAEAAASPFAAYASGAGLVSTGAHVEARYRLAPGWTVVGSFDHEVLRGGAAASPIVAIGSARQSSVAVTLMRRFSF